MTKQSVGFSTNVKKSLLLSNAASSKVAKMKQDENNDNLKLRVYITGGGCSGFQYGFKFDETINDDDFVVENKGVTLLADSTSMIYLNGAEIDFSSGLEGERFFVNNPNAQTTCGCGSSFSV